MVSLSWVTGVGERWSEVEFQACHSKASNCHVLMKSSHWLCPATALKPGPGLTIPSFKSQMTPSSQRKGFPEQGRALVQLEAQRKGLSPGYTRNSVAAVSSSIP
jgi:hypothetical protein